MMRIGGMFLVRMVVVVEVEGRGEVRRLIGLEWTVVLFISVRERKSRHTAGL